MMKQLSITYIHNLLPYIQITPDGLNINKDYAHSVDKEYLKAILHSEGYYNAPDWLIEAIKGYSDVRNDGKNVTVVFNVE